MKTIAELKALPQWVGYNPTKVPLDPHTGRAAASNNPETWSTASEAWAAKRRYGWAGIGYVFTLSAGVIGIDLDKCFDDEGQLSDTARQIVEMVDSYTERSPSGRGLHILACGSIPDSVKQPGFEMYNELRYFTVTGHVYGEPRHIEDRQTELDALYAIHVDDAPVYEPIDSSFSTNNRYTQAALMRAMQAVSLAANGGRNNTLYAETAALVELVNGGGLERADVERVMTAAGIAAGLESTEATKTIASAFKAVTKARPVPPPKPRYSATEDMV